MNLNFERYQENLNQIPRTGKHILAFQENDHLVIYQAFNDQIAEFALKHQRFGGDAYSFNRMSWIKTNFLWMMYRSGWGTKPGQENILAIWIRKSFMDELLEQSVLSIFSGVYYKSIDDWKNDLANKEVRLQWDPDHDPNGVAQERRAIQLGLKGKLLRKFCENEIQKIECINEFVLQQREYVSQRKLGELMIPKERTYLPSIEKTRLKIELSK